MQDDGWPPARRAALTTTIGSPAMLTVFLSRAARLLEDRLLGLEGRVQRGDEAAWSDYLVTVTAYTAVLAQLTPGAHGGLLTTKQLAERLNVSSKTILKQKKQGKLRPALQLGQRGRAAIRWRADQTPR